MNYKDIVVDKLKNYEAKKSSIENMQSRIVHLKERSTYLKGAITDKVPVKGGMSHSEDMMVDDITEVQELELNIKVVEKEVSCLDTALEKLNPTERRVIELFFINRCHNYIDLLCDEFAYDKSTIYRIKDAALKNITYNLYGIVGR